MQFTIKQLINISLSKIDIYEWLKNLTSEDYESFSEAHIAMGKYEDELGLRLVNVEDIGGGLITQYYYFNKAEKKHVILHSDRSLVLVLHWIPVKVKVPWEMAVIREHDKTYLTCTIGAIFPNKFLELAAKSMFLGYFLRRHLKEECQSFVQDLEKKYGPEA